MNIGIGELSRRTGVKVTTIRYYEEIGLLSSPPRTEGKQRRYDEADVSRLGFIRHARDLGFAVSAIRELLALSAYPERSCAEVDAIARGRIDDVERRIGQLEALGAELRRMVDECGHGRMCDCRVIQVLADHRHCEQQHH